MADSIRPNEKGIYCTIDKRVADCDNFSLRYLEYKFFRAPLCIGEAESVPLKNNKKFRVEKESS